jgi:tetratricopeptide (TPR) repeat protein
MGNHDKAIELLERAKLINPHNVDRLIDLGHAFINADQLEAANAQFEEALGLDGDRKEAKEGKGQVMLMNGDVNEALTLLKSVSGPRELASIFNTSAVLSIRAGRFDQGMQLYRSALAALGRNDKIAARLLFNMGMGYERMHKAEKALTCYTKSLELDPMYAKAARHKEVAEKAVAAGGGKAVPAPDAAEAPFDEEDFAGRGAGKKKNALLPDEPLHDNVDFDDDADEDKSS